ncbi:MAG TPA: T9SS type A sorting domain-containing protein [Bacteroidales bacterium]|nr:T9SS type A sorting domain-containing protein [Bacteroidales bacterium]
MKSFIFAFFIALSTVGALAQSISHQVLLPAAGITTVGSVSYQQTVGETAVSILTIPANTLTQGFQQPRVIFTNDTTFDRGEIEVYPNPVTKDGNNKLYVILTNSESRSYIVTIYNFAGSVVYLWSSNSYLDQAYRLQVDVKDFSRGIYIVRVMSTDKQINRSFKIEKL